MKTQSGWSDTEKARRLDVESGKTVIANMKTDFNLINWAKNEGLFVVIGRPSIWGNPFIISRDRDRETVCRLYENQFKANSTLHCKLETLVGKVLGCYCYPEQCHGDFLARLVNEGITL